MPIRRYPLDAISALYEEYGIVPGGVDHPYTTSELYYDSNYGGATNEKTSRNEWPTSEDEQPKKTVTAPDAPLEGQVSDGVTYKYNPELGILLIDGDGTVTAKENKAVIDKCSEYYDSTGVMINYIIFGKNVKQAKEYSDEYTGCNTWLLEHTNIHYPYRVCTYKDSFTEKEFGSIVDYFTEQGNAEGMKNFSLIVIDEDVDPIDFVNGKEDIFRFDTFTKKPAYVIKPTEPETPAATEPIDVKLGSPADPSKATLRGDADVSGDVGISDIVAVTKFLLSDSSYPLKNETAKANADMNKDKVINGLDTSALIENQLGKR